MLFTSEGAHWVDGFLIEIYVGFMVLAELLSGRNAMQDTFSCADLQD